MWYALRLAGLPRSELDHASTLLFALGASGLQEDWMPGTAPAPRQPWDEGPTPPPPDPLVLTAWFDGPDRAHIDAQLLGLSAERTWEHVEDQDWAALGRRGFDPVHISPRLVIAAPWDAPEGAIVIEPGIGFGTGQHPTTRQALAAVDALSAPPHRTVLDVGCGSGILALAAAHLGLEAHGIDIEHDAVLQARLHAERNGSTATFDHTPIEAVTRTYDVVLANVHAEAVVTLAAELRRLTRSTLVVAGVLDSKEQLVVDALMPLEPVHREQDGPWVCLWFTSA